MLRYEQSAVEPSALTLTQGCLLDILSAGKTVHLEAS